MRKLGMVLAGLGGFLVMLAILAKFYAPGQLMKTPLDVDSTTNAAGEAAVGGHTDGAGRRARSSPARTPRSPTVT